MAVKDVRKFHIYIEDEFKSCSTCRVKPYCLISEECAVDTSSFPIHKQERKLFPKQELFSKDENVSNVYILKQGLIKTFTLSKSGQMIIMGLNYPGDLIALDCMYSDKYFYYAEAVLDSVVCLVNKEMIINKEEARNYLSNKINEQKNMFRVLSKLTSTQRTCYFLVSHSKKLGRVGYPAEHFSLGLTRVDIANYLGLSSETLSRTLTKLKAHNILENKGSFFSIKNRAKLVSYCSPMPESLIYSTM